MMLNKNTVSNVRINKMTDKHDFKAAFANILLYMSEEDYRANIKYIEVVKKGLRIADRLQSGEVSQGFQSMAQAGAVEMWEQSKSGLIGHNQATKIYQAMAQQMIKEEIER